MDKKIKNLKKIELHLHLDGSVSLDVAKKITNLPIETLKEKMMISNNNNSLTDYLKAFDFPISIMQSKKNLKMIAQDLIEKLKEDNIIYAEIRFAPVFHTKDGLTTDEVILAILDGLKNDTVKTNLIICLMRNETLENNLKSLNSAIKFFNKGVCAIDLAGDENNYKINNDINYLFNIAKNNNIPFTIHAGEINNSSEIEKAIELGASRIGHGISCINDQNILNVLNKKQILLEICPTSNIQTKVIDNYSNHPIYSLYKQGILTSINTDNKTVSNITLSDEYQKLIDTFNLNISDLIKMNIYALEKSFLNEEEKKDILRKLKSDQ